MIKETTAYSTTSGVVYKDKDEARRAELYDFLYKKRNKENLISYSPPISVETVEYIIKNKEEFIDFLRSL